MSEQNADAKAGSPVINQDGLGASSASDSPQFSRDDLNIIDTVDVIDGGKGAESAEKSPEKGKEKGDDARYDKDPAWQRIIQERNEEREARIRAEAKLEVLSKGEKKAEGEEVDTDEYKPIYTYEDVTKWDDDVIREKLEDNPKGFITNLFAQIVDETRKVLLAEQAQSKQQKTIQSTFDKFADTHKGDPEAGIKGFREMWDSKEIQQYMKANPGHNAMSAYLEMTLPAREKAIAEKAARTAADMARKNKEVKDGARSLGAGPGGAPSHDKNAELKNTKERGGIVQTLAQRLIERRQSGG